MDLAGNLPESSFNSLPFTVQQFILHKLSSKDKSNARLVCTNWFFHINSFHKPNGLLTNNNNSLEILTNSFYQSVGKLLVHHMVDELPIYSSQRSNLPTANHLQLGRGNSKVNVLKLLRYHARYAQALSLFTCFSKLKNYQLKLGIEVANIRELEFYTTSTPEERSELSQDNLERQRSTPIWNHIVALAGLLSTVRMEKLQKLRAYIFYSDRLNNNAGIRTIAGIFSEAFKQFMMKQGPRLRTLNIWVSGRCNDGIVEHLGYCRQSVENLEFWYLPGSDIRQTNLTKAVSSFQYLRTLGLYFYDEITERHYSSPHLISALKTSGPSLESLVVLHYLNSVHWLHATAFQNLKHIQLILTKGFDTGFGEAKTKCYKLNCLTSMTILGFQRTSAHKLEEWFPELLDWIVQIGSNIKFLKLLIGGSLLNPDAPNDFHFEIEHVSKLLGGLPFLRELDLFPNDRVPQPLSFPIEEWCNGMDGLHGKWVKTLHPIHRNAQLHCTRFNRKILGYFVSVDRKIMARKALLST